MTTLVIEPPRVRRLDQLYEISKLFNAFDSAGETLDAALKVIAETLPLESAILIESVLGGYTDMVVWPCSDSDPERMRTAKAHAASAYAYMVGADRLDDASVREDRGLTMLRSPARDIGYADAANRYIVLPLVVARRAVFGALQIEGAGRLDRDDLEFVNAIANQFAVALDRDRSWSYDVLRRQEAQIAHARYESLVDHLDHAFVWEAELESHRITYASAQLERMLGFSRREVLDEADWWAAHVHADELVGLRRAFTRAIAEPGHQRYDHRCIARDGGVRWLHTSIRCVGNRGETPRFQGVSFDITAARATQDLAHEQLAFTTAMASSLGEGTIAVDLEGQITFMNEAAAELLGCHERESLGVLADDLGHLESRTGEPLEAPLTAAMRTGGRIRSDANWVVRTDLARFPVAYTATPIRRAGRVTGAVVAFDDITERVRAQATERFLLAAGSSLAADLEIAAVVATVARLGVPLLGDLCFVDVISAEDDPFRVAWAHTDPAEQLELDRMLGATQGIPVLARAVVEVIATGHSMRVPIVEDAWFSVADLPITRRFGITSALIVPMVLGDRRLGALTLAMSGTRVLDDADVALAEELARRSATAVEHARLYQRAQLAVARREQTLAIVSHDLRSPLATIILASTMIAEERASTGASVKAVDTILRATGRMNRLIDDLLDVASIEAGTFSITPAACDAATIVEAAMAAFETIATKRRVTLTGEVGPGLAELLCDRDRIVQVIANLVANALEVVSSGDVVRLRVKRGVREAIVSVSDSGPGIKPADQVRLFDRYWRSPEAAYKGTGLGLAIAHGIVAAHGGRLWVDSELGRGATFSFTIPLVEQPFET